MDLFIGSPAFHDELWWLTSIILALGRCLQEDWLHSEFKVSLCYLRPVKLDLGQVSSLQFELLVVPLSCWFKCFFLSELVCVSTIWYNMQPKVVEKAVKDSEKKHLLSVCLRLCAWRVYWSQSPPCRNRLCLMSSHSWTGLVKKWLPIFEEYFSLQLYLLIN